MPRPALVYSAFIASPSDVADEREIVQRVILEWNSTHSRDSGAIIEPVRWERDSVPEMGGHPQKLLKKQIVEWGDLCIALFWTKVGTPTPDAESGTIEEIEEFVRANKPVLLYFSNKPAPPNSMSAKESQRLSEVKAHYQELGIYGEFDSEGDLHNKLSNHLAKWMHRLHTRATSGIPASQVGAMQLPTPAAASSHAAEILEQLAPAVRRFEVGWTTERDSSYPNTQDAKYLATDLAGDLLQLHGQVDGNKLGEVEADLKQAIARAKEVNKHHLSLDGGVSFHALWQLGDDLITHLHAVEGKLRALK